MDYELTSEQKTIVQKGLSARLLVTAGPGTGKTSTLIRRMDFVIARHQVAPGAQLLTLSFSQGAVGEIKRRCKQLADDSSPNLRFVNVTTFDSFSSKLLYAAGRQEEIVGMDYDGRIEAAVRLIETGGADDFIKQLKHVFIDEVQDLISIRAHLVRVLLKRLADEAGFSLFGDPAQGIYDFQASDPRERRDGSARFYAELRNAFKGVLEEAKLTKNHRAATDSAKVGLWAADDLRSLDSDFDEVLDGLQQVIKDLPDIPGKGTANFDALGKHQGTLAVLCRDNGGALWVSKQLSKAGVEHSYFQGSRGRVFPPWMAKTLANFPMLVTRKMFMSRCEEIGVTQKESLEYWNKLKLIESGGNPTSINLSEINKRIRRAGAPDWLSEHNEKPLVVSSIHRAKGREFDAVVILDPDYKRTIEFASEESRVLFVAVTRARRLNRRLALERAWLPRLDQKSDRWFGVPRSSSSWGTNMIEFRASDIDASLPVRDSEEFDSYQEQQDYLVEKVRVGDEVTLVLEKEGAEGYDTVYQLHHNGVLIGDTTKQFTRQLYFLLRGRWGKSRLPDTIEGLRITGLQTVFGDPAEVGKEGQSSPAVAWLSPVISGLGDLKWDKESEEE